MSADAGDRTSRITIRRLSSRDGRKVRVEPAPPRRRIELERRIRRIRVEPGKLKPRRLSPDQLWQPVIIHAPTDGQTFEASAVEVTGRSHPGVRLALVNGQYRTETRASLEGIFSFSGVPLDAGANTLMVLDLDHLKWELGRTSVRVVHEGCPLPFLDDTDPLTGAPLLEGELVVRCSVCWTYCYYSSWAANGTCSICCMRGLYPSYWTAENEEFHMARQELKER